MLFRGLSSASKVRPPAKSKLQTGAGIGPDLSFVPCAAGSYGVPWKHRGRFISTCRPVFWYRSTKIIPISCALTEIMIILTTTPHDKNS
ncbi:hypothetical protein GDO81_006664 [Engystomops pustulosus]|uniref:Uncharacterized protein n=1 Tax=Engystomops pustulosus TaxID=76066 RepID=A0AAV7CYE8_ENGPU|nr:hypothetical protein GDO81_006664 [Engystomops pustulosus]